MQNVEVVPYFYNTPKHRKKVAHAAAPSRRALATRIAMVVGWVGPTRVPMTQSLRTPAYVPP